MVVRNRGADGSYTLYHTKGADYRVGCTRSTIQSTLVRGLIGAEQNTKQREKLRFRIPDLSVSGADISPSLPSGVSQDYVQETTRRSPLHAVRLNFDKFGLKKEQVAYLKSDLHKDW